MSIFDNCGTQIMPDDNKVENGIAVIPIKGILTRAGSWWDPGTDEIAELFNEIQNDNSIVATILDTDCNGGSSYALFPLMDAFKKKQKPCIAAINGVAYSLGYFADIFADKIYAVNKMCSVGSIGVYTELTDYSQMMKKLYGIKTIEVYPPESEWKNKPQRQALKGDDSLLIKELLSPWAQYFQENVRAQRPTLNETIEGTLNGRAFFADYTSENGMNAGLIDGVMPFDEIIQYAYNLATAQKTRSIFNNLNL